MKKLALITAAAALLVVPAMRAQSNTGTTSLSCTVGPEASINVGTSTTTLSHSGTLFANYTGTTNFTYKIRTTEGTGSGSITAYVSTDFGTGGPSAGSPVNGDTLTYTCSGDSSGTPCSSAQTATTTSGSATNVASFSSGAHSATAGDSGSVVWTLTDDPAYKTGTYTATVTFTVSAA